MVIAKHSGRRPMKNEIETKARSTAAVGGGVVMRKEGWWEEASLLCPHNRASPQLHAKLTTIAE